MIKGGTKPTRISKKDYDLHATFGTITTTPVFPTEYFTDAGLDVPDQNSDGLPFGCTDESQSELANDLVQKQATNPWQLEQVTHANALGGYDIRKSLLAAVKLGWFTAFFNIQPHQLDFFDSIRLAMISGIPEKRSVSTGTPWYPIFEQTDSIAILRTPQNLQDPNLTWHNWCIKGWKVINGQTYLIGKSWQGASYGDKGYCYFSRELFNTLMNIPGAVAFTATKGQLPPISTISAPLWAWLVSNIKSLLGYTY